MSGGAHSQMKQVMLRCTECGHDSYIWRRRSKLKEKSHVKHLWCSKCEERTAHLEVRED